MTDITIGARYGHLEVVAVDPTGRRIACRCICERLIGVAADALRDGRTSCGCRPLTRQAKANFKIEHERRQRQREFARRPDRNV